MLCTDATVADDGSVIGDPTEAAFVVLAGKMGVDAGQTLETTPGPACTFRPRPVLENHGNHEQT